jgi:hypothetical protein
MNYGFRRASLIAASAILCSLGTSSPALAQSDGMFFDGGGSGPTEEIAIERAFNDAEISASASQLFTCEPVGEPQIFPDPDNEFGRFFRAQVRVFCTS